MHFSSSHSIIIQDWREMNSCFLFIFIFIHLAPAQKSESDQAQETKFLGKQWQTLSGNDPLVLARGGNSGIFPEASNYAVESINSTSLLDTITFCNLQLTKDGDGICLTDIRLDNETNIGQLFPKDKKTYKVNGKYIEGWFAIDYPTDLLVNNVTLCQNVLSRTHAFDGMLSVSTIDSVYKMRRSAIWLNVEYDMFYSEHNLSMALYIQETLKVIPVNYISSPEIGLLKNIGGKLNKENTKLILVLREDNAVEPTTKKTYGHIVKDLPSIKSFAAGLLVPKEYIWPVDKDNYLQEHSTLVADAHRQGLEVYASGFANDFLLSFNYSFDPVAEYLQFIDNSEFSVDGFLTDFPSTASETIACFAQNKNGNRPTKGNALIISHNGASGAYPSCTNLAYQQAIDAGVDIIDCSVQMTRDGVAICLSSPDTVPSSNAMGTFLSRSATIPEIQQNVGIFTFDLSWDEIRSLTPQIESPFLKDGFIRNPANKNKGKFISVSDFLELAKAKGVSGILINIENAAYLASKKGLGIVDAIKGALSNATFDKQSTQEVFIRSDDTSVLSMFQDTPTYKRVFYINDTIGDAPKEAVEEVKMHADVVDVRRTSLIPTDHYFLSNATQVLKEFHDANVSVHVSVLRNEFITLPIDFNADPSLEIATYVRLGVDGIVTDFPATVTRYLRSPCSDPEKDEDLPFTIHPALDNGLLPLINPQAVPAGSEAEPPSLPLNPKDVVDPPLPPVSRNPGPAPRHEGESHAPGLAVANMGLSLAAILVPSLLLYT